MPSGLVYNPSLPQFGGRNGQALTLFQYERDLEAQRRAARAAAEAPGAGGNDPFAATRRLTDAITNYLNVEIARRFSNEILYGSSPTGSVDVGDVLIEYSRDGDILTVRISDDAGTTEVELPVIEMP